MLKLKVEKRDLSENLDLLRGSGKMPAVFYGPKNPSTSIKLVEADFKRAWIKAGESTIISLEGEGIDADVLIHAVDLDPVTDVPIHADFYAIDKDKELTIDIALEFIGVAPAVKDFGAVLVKVLHEVEIEALSKDLPHNLEVDVSTLTTLDSVLTASDIKLPPGVSLKTKADEVIASVYLPEEEVVEVAPVDLSTIEVQKKGKEVEEGVEEESGKVEEKK